MTEPSPRGRDRVSYKRKLYKFRFEGPDLAGLEVVTKPVTMEEILDLTGDVDALQQGTANKEAVLKMAGLLASCLVSWTVEDEDGTPAPLPATGKDLLAEDAALTMAIMTEWSQRMFKVAPPLPDGSGSGATSGLEQSLPMEPLSPSPPNSEEPG